MLAVVSERAWYSVDAVFAFVYKGGGGGPAQAAAFERFVRGDTKHFYIRAERNGDLLLCKRMPCDPPEPNFPFVAASVKPIGMSPQRHH